MVVRRIEDGRVARGERTREVVAAAVLSLLDDGVLRPTRQQVAERAGVSLRLVHHHFREREGLLAAAARLQNERVSKRIAEVPRTGSFERRLAAFVAARAEVLEAITSVRRAARAEEPFSEVVQGSLHAWRKLKREQVSAVFEAELARLRGRARDEVAAAAACIASWSSWDELRHNQGLDREAATGVMKRALARLLEPRRKA